MKVSKIGLVTLFKNNYGSALQGYAIKTVIENLGYNCELLFELQNNENDFRKKIYKSFKLIYNSIVFSGYLRSFLSMREAMKVEQNYLSSTSLKYIDQFIMEFLCPQGYTWEELCRIGLDSEYEAFIVGSDQVWNASRTVKPFYFLRFSPKNKRHTYAVSFGVSDVPKWNLRDLKKGMEGFNCISVRENKGKDIVRLCTSVDIIKNIDPTMLLSDKEWRNFYKESKIQYKQFILFYFLNAPSELAINAINFLSEKSGLNVLGFAYYYEEYKKINKIKLIDGGPKEYIALIDKASYVFTDSFHTTIFSINLHSNFYVFHRQYLHGFPQTNRIVDLLDRFGLSNRLISDLKNIEIDCSFEKEHDEIIKEERSIALNYIEKELKKKD
jgi:hypothetical protein